MVIGRRSAAGAVSAPPLVLALVAAAGALATVLAFGIVISADRPGDQTLSAFLHALIVAVPVAVGLWAWAARPDGRFGQLLVVAGFVWSLTTLSESNDAVAYSAGRVAEWLAEPVLIALVLSFPSGRLRRRVDRLVVLVAVSAVGLLYLPTALLADRYPEPSPLTFCKPNCPDNAFQVVSSEPAFLDAFVIPLRELISVALFAAVLVVLLLRVRMSTHLMRRALMPVLSVAVLRAGIFVVYIPMRRVMPDSSLLDGLAWIYLLCLPAFALAFFVGVVRARLLAGVALQRLAIRLREHPDHERLTAILREAMDDPTLELAYWAPGPRGRWVDGNGRRVARPAEGSGRSLTEVREGNRLVAALVHDAALDDMGGFLKAAGSLALSSLENQQLSAKVDASLLELRESRARIQAAADGERQRIERDLHDGAQQRLVALRIKLGMVGDVLREDSSQGEELVRALGQEAEAALDEIRSLAQGVYPSLLADEGLGEALRALGRRSEPVARVVSDGVGRLPPEVESAVYFCCLEAVQNVAKHAAGARSLAISIHVDGDLRFEVRDDGAGFAAGAIRRGAGLANMRDRIEAVNGSLTVSSKQGVGTTVRGTIPLL